MYYWYVPFRYYCGYGEPYTDHYIHSTIHQNAERKEGTSAVRGRRSSFVVRRSHFSSFVVRRCAVIIVVGGGGGSGGGGGGGGGGFGVGLLLSFSLSLLLSSSCCSRCTSSFRPQNEFFGPPPLLSAHENTTNDFVQTQKFEILSWSLDTSQDFLPKLLRTLLLQRPKAEVFVPVSQPVPKMKEGFLLAGLLALANSAVSVAGPEKIVIHTPWWPAGSERTSEAVGILSRGEIFMTGMMESNHTLDLQIEQELLDVRDIAVGGESDMNHVVSCFVNSKYAGSAAAVHQAMAEQTSAFGGAAVTVVESAGEWSVFNNSVTCRAVQASASDKVVLHGEEGTNDVAVVANNLVHISVEGTDINDALNKTSVFLQEATNSTTSTAAIVDCFVGVTQLSEAPTVRAAFNTSAIVPTLTIVQVGLVPGATVALQCVASLNATDVVVSPQLPAPMDEGFATPRAVTAGGFVYVDGVPAADINGTDGLVRLQFASLV